MCDQRDRPLWQTKAGIRVPVSSMTTGHIRNALAMLKRNGFVSESAVAMGYMSLGGTMGEEAECYLEQELEHAKVSRFIDIFEQELAHRGEA